MCGRFVWPSCRQHLGFLQPNIPAPVVAVLASRPSLVCRRPEPLDGCHLKVGNTAKRCRIWMPPRKLRSCSGSWRASSPIKFEEGLRGRGREGQHTQTQTRGNLGPLLRGHVFNPSPVPPCRPANLSPPLPPLEKKFRATGRPVEAPRPLPH